MRASRAVRYQSSPVKTTPSPQRSRVESRNAPNLERLPLTRATAPSSTSKPPVTSTSTPPATFQPNPITTAVGKLNPRPASVRTFGSIPVRASGATRRSATPRDQACIRGLITIGRLCR